MAVCALKKTEESKDVTPFLLELNRIYLSITVCWIEGHKGNTQWWVIYAGVSHRVGSGGDGRDLDAVCRAGTLNKKKEQTN